MRFEIILGEFCSNLSVKDFLFEFKLTKSILFGHKQLLCPAMIFFTLLGDSFIVLSFKAQLIAVPVCNLPTGNMPMSTLLSLKVSSFRVLV